MTDPLEAAFVAGAVAALRKRAALRRERASTGVVIHENGTALATSEARVDLNIAADLEAIATEIESSPMKV
jgi:hypothetical protein